MQTLIIKYIGFKISKKNIFIKRDKRRMEEICGEGKTEEIYGR